MDDLKDIGLILLGLVVASVTVLGLELLGLGGGQRDNGDVALYFALWLAVGTIGNRREMKRLFKVSK